MWKRKYWVLWILAFNFTFVIPDAEYSCQPPSDMFSSLGNFVQVFFRRTWPHGKVYFEMDASLSQEDHRVVKKSMKIIERLSCVRFVTRRAKDMLYVRIMRECRCDPTRKRCAYTGAYANVGPLPGGRLVISGACLSIYDNRSVGLVTHELFHTLGFNHHHERIDRDKYVSINYLNIQIPRLSSYKWNPLYLPNNIPYDCNSLMHYSDKSFSNGKGPTMTPRFPHSCDLTKTNYRPSAADIQLVNSVYKCRKKYSHRNP